MQPNWMEDPSEQPNKAAGPTKNVSVEDKGYPTGDIDEIWEPRPVRLPPIWGLHLLGTSPIRRDFIVSHSETDPP